jgi:cytochrome b involved in lipid metabolism
MIKNLVTISLMIFIILLVGVLGATVFFNQGKVNAPSNIEQVNNASIQGQVSTVLGGDEDNNANDEEGEDGGNYNTGGGTVTTPPITTIPSNPPATTPAPPTSGITLSQVAQHNTRSNCWMVISGKVYNFTSYMNAHPGGISTILPLCGKDGTSAYATKGGQGSHSQTAYNLLNNYYVGNLVK